VRWSRQGLLVPAPAPVEWARSHAALPVPEERDDQTVRVYFAARDERGRSRIGHVDDVFGPQPQYSSEPSLDLGPLGAFDDSGVTTGCVVRNGDARFLYYSGWSLGVTVPFYFYVGCAVSIDNGPFERVSSAPILERSDADPYLTASPWVLLEGERWRMWYVSCTGWSEVDGAPRHSYLIKYAESSDGVEWVRPNHVCIGFADESEYAFGRPCVLWERGRYRMWYSVRGRAYRLGYAESEDGLEWVRRDDLVQLEGNSEDWDAEMQAYPVVFDHGGLRRMLWNGNGYGQTGIGHASAAG
jgi:hypothetical protein